MKLLDQFIAFIRPTSTSEVVLKALALIQSQGALIMATLAEVQAGLAKLVAVTAAEKTEAVAAQAASTDAIKTLGDQVAALKAQVLTGGAASATDLDAILAQIQGVDAAVQAIIPV